MVFCMIPATAFAAEYGDTEGHWAEGAIDRWSGYGVIEGMDGLFLPDGELTRAQLAAILTRLLNLPAATDAGFSDVDSDEWYATYINSCAKAGIMLGSNGQARPNDTISRQESMVMIGRALGIQPVANPDLSGYADQSSVADWAAGYVAAMTEKGIVNGTTTTTVGGTDEINRGSMVTILDRAILTVITEPGTVIAGDGEGIIIVAAPDVTISGSATGIVITPEAGGEVKLDGMLVSEAVVVMAEDTTVTVGDNSVVGIVAVTESAEGAKVEVTETAKVELVDNKAENTTVAGAGKVENVTTSGNNTTVTTGGTKVEAAEGTTGTTVGGKDVAGGTTETVVPTTPSTSGGTSVPVHSHTYGVWLSNEDGTHTQTCLENEEHKNTESCVYNESGTCGKCGYNVAAVAKTGEDDNRIYHMTLKDAVTTVCEAGGTVEMLSDVMLDEGLVFNGTHSVLLSMNEHTIKASPTMKSYAVILAEGDVELCINGYGTVDSASQGNDYNIAVWARENAIVEIQDGTFTNVDGNDYDEVNKESNNNELIYASGKGQIIITNDPVFKGNVSNSTHQAKYTLNIQDNSSASIKVYGGEFHGFNPASANTEPIAPYNFVDESAHVENEGDIWTVIRDYKVEYGKAVAYTTEGLTKVLEKGYEYIKLAHDLTSEAIATAPYGNKVAYVQNGGILDGNGRTLSVTNQDKEYVILTYGGIIKNLKIDYGFRGIVLYAPTEDVILDNVDIGGEVCYAINTAEHPKEEDEIKLTVTNSTIRGWTSFAGLKSASFTNCIFGQGDYYKSDSGRLIKPYIDTLLKDCEFSYVETKTGKGFEGYYIDLSALKEGCKVTFENCYVKGQKVTAENWMLLFDEIELPKDKVVVDGVETFVERSLEDCVIFK